MRDHARLLAVGRETLPEELVGGAHETSIRHVHAERERKGHDKRTWALLAHDCTEDLREWRSQAEGTVPAGAIGPSAPH